ncbi:MAG: hypothetical protein MZV65_18490 [Chromatiales bacterium]|nr:hypothetical protein [Chromatiales bacterium]
MGLWEVVNNLTRLRPTQRQRYRVTIFGSARIPKDHWVYAAVRDTAEELTRLGCDIVTGGGPGLMAAANEGVMRADPNARERSLGHARGPALRAGRECLWYTRLRTSHVLHAPASVRADVGRVRRRSRRGRDGARSDDDLAAPPGPAPARHAADSDRQNVRGARRLVPGLHAAAGVSLASPGDMDLPQCVDDGAGIIQIVRAHHAGWVEARKMSSSVGR